jgi:flagellar biosynthesis/type III secretory pathway M-ring protein FliF/YscJ
MTLFWWARYSSEPVQSPLLDQSFSSDEIAQITSRLDAKGINYTVSGDRILVSADRKTEVLADLSFNHLLPQKMNAAFDEIVKQMTPWDPETKDDRLWVEITQRELASIIGGYPSVRDANVIIDRTSERSFDGHDLVPTAMVNITTDAAGDPGVNVKKIATAAADAVAAAVAGLSPGSVAVVIDGATIPVADKSAGGWTDSDSVAEAKQQSEEMYQRKVMEQLGYIKGRVFASVSVSLNTQKVQTQITKYDPKTSAQLPVTTEDHSTESTGPAPAAEPGAVSNLTTSGALSASGGGGAGGGSSSTETESKATNEVRFGQTVETTSQDPGDAEAVAAAVRVPRSYFVNTYKDDHKGADADDAALLAWTKEESDKILKDVQLCTNIKTPETIVVNSWDDGDAVAGAPAAAAAATSPVTLLVGSHYKEMGVGALAVVSLFMVMMMVRKSAPVPLPAEAAEEEEEKGPTTKLKPESMVAGEVSEGDRTLDGMELDDEAVKTQQVVEQVSAMVAENPDGAANLVKRWLNRT